MSSGSYWQSFLKKTLNEKIKKFVRKQINHQGIYYVPIANVQNIYDVIGWEEYNIGRYVLLVSIFYILLKQIGTTFDFRSEKNKFVNEI